MRNKKSRVKVVKIEVEMEGGNKHSLFFTPRELWVMIGAMSVLNDLGACEAVLLVATEHVNQCFLEHMNSLEEGSDPEHVHQIFHRLRDFFVDREIA